MTNVYTHGHHESVLRSHRWRTAENSAGYLLPLLKPGMRLLDVGCGPGTITMDLAELVGPEGRVTALERTDDALALARAEAGATGRHERRLRGRRRAGPRPRGRLVRRGARPPGAAARRRPGPGAARDGPGLPARRDRRGARERLRRVRLVPRGARARPVARGLPAGGAFQRRRAGRRTPPAVLGAGRWTRGRRRPDRAPGASRRRRTGPGGAASGPTGSSSPTLARQAVERGFATAAELAAIAAGWRRWADARRRLVQRAARRDPRHRPGAGG